MAIKRQTQGEIVAENVELAAFLIDNEAEYIEDEIVASDMAHASTEFQPGSLPLNVYLHAMAAQLREIAKEVRKLK